MKNSVLYIFVACAFPAGADIGQLLESKSKETSEAIVADVQTHQQLFDKQLELQFQINDLRNKMSSVSGSDKVDLEKQIQALEKQKNNL